MNVRQQRLLEASSLVNLYERSSGRRHGKHERGHAFVACCLRLAMGAGYNDLRTAALRYAAHCRRAGQQPVDALTFYSETWHTFAQETACTGATSHAGEPTRPLTPSPPPAQALEAQKPPRDALTIIMRAG